MSYNPTVFTNDSSAHFGDKTNVEAHHLDADLTSTFDEERYINDFGDESWVKVQHNEAALSSHGENEDILLSSTITTKELTRQPSNHAVQAVEEEYQYKVTVTHITIPEPDEVMPDGSYYIPGDPFATPLTKKHITRHLVGEVAPPKLEDEYYSR